ncbi:MAG: beta-ketoacyl-ACP synthase II [Chitinivibrionales bacterium]|nr:beta-ketoacyl-ACP synthase II [Chitinivibrionales bacterium]
MSKKRVVITGLGIIAPIGSDTNSFWNAAVKGTNGIRPIQSFDISDFRTKVGGEVLDFDPAQYIGADQLKFMGRSSQFAVAASQMALAESGLAVDRENPYRIGVAMGTTMGEPQVLEKGIQTKYDTGDPNQIPSGLPRQYPCGVIPSNIAAHFNTAGPVIMIPTACAAGNYALGYAYDLICLDEADVVIAGGSDPISKIAFTGFNRLLATAKEVCRPFDKNRDGMAVGEGAGILIVEELEHALKRGAEIYAEILGYGLGCDAFKMTIPDPTGSGGIRALNKALRNAGISSDEIDYICAHGTGTGENDKSETLIIKETLGKRAYDVPISSLKSMCGHTMGAASAIEAAACIMTLKHNVILPTINYSEPDPDCDLDYVPNEAREKEVDTVVSNAYAFGGNTSSIIFRKFKG